MSVPHPGPGSDPELQNTGSAAVNLGSGAQLFSDEFAASLRNPEAPDYGAATAERSPLPRGGVLAAFCGGCTPPGLQKKAQLLLQRGFFSFGTSAGLNVVLFTLMPWAAFSLTMWPFALGYRESPGFAWMVFGLFVICAIAFAAVGASDAGKPRLYWRVLSLFCFVSTILGMAWGIYDYRTYVTAYHMYKAARAYTNVAPNADPGGLKDAGIVEFSTEAVIDTSRALGYKNEITYCVAPVVDMTRLQQPGPGELIPQVGFWAAGLDCCEARGSFWCGNIDKASVHGGLVIRQWSTPMEHALPHYRTAIEQAGAAFGFGVPADAVIVEWIEDINGRVDGYWISGVRLVIHAAVGFITVLLTLGVLCALYYDSLKRFYLPNRAPVRH